MYAQHRLLSAIKGHMRGISTPGNSQANSICSVHDGSKFMYQDVCHKIPTHYGDATFPNVLFRRSDKDLGRVTPATEQLTQSSAHFSVCDSSWSNSARNGFNTFLTTTGTCFWRTGPLTSVKVIGKRLTPIMGLAKYKVIPLHYQNQTPVPNDIKCLYHKEDGHHLNYRYLPWKLQAKKYKRRKISSFAQDAANLQPSF